MPLSATLPTPSEHALQHSHKVQQAIRSKIKTSDNWITFADYMQMVLYAPGLGYYSAGTSKLGDSGDFVTAPEISVLFGQTLARQAEQILNLIDHADILEFGAGSGRLALDLLLELEKLDCLPDKYFILEVSADLRQRQHALFEKKAPHLLPLLRWLDQLPTQFNGFIIANEVLDAMPVHLVTWREEKIFERGVTWLDDKFAWQERPLLAGPLFEIASGLLSQNDTNGIRSDSYTSEINLTARQFIRSMNDILQHGAVILIDYGFGGDEYYHPQRDQGTLMCHYRHHSHNDPFYLPGLQDVTSHVDFSAVYHAMENTELNLLGYTTQAHFLVNCGVTSILSQTPSEEVGEYLPLSNQLQKLTSPAEMGELFKVIALGKNIDEPLIGFNSGDKSHLL